MAQATREEQTKPKKEVPMDAVPVKTRETAEYAARLLGYAQGSKKYLELVKTLLPSPEQKPAKGPGLYPVYIYKSFKDTVNETQLAYIKVNRKEIEKQLGKLGFELEINGNRIEVRTAKHKAAPL